MTELAPAYRALAVQYAERATTRGDAYYRWASYGEPDGPLDMSYYFWVLQPIHDPAAAPIVVDCGFDPALGERMGRNTLCPTGEALTRLGIDPAAVERLVITHIHYDHVGNLHLFPNARMAVAAVEFDFWTADPVSRRRHFSSHADPNGIDQLRAAAAEGRVDLLGDEAEVAPGVTSIRVGGHGPGQLVLSVAGEDGDVVLSSDAVHYYEELETERPFAVFFNLADMYRGYDTVRRLTEGGAALVPGHDPLVMQRFEPVDGAGADIAVRITPTRSQS